MEVEAGNISYSDCISKHWPAFGQNGKEEITIKHVLQHQVRCNIHASLNISVAAFFDDYSHLISQSYLFHFYWFRKAWKYRVRSLFAGRFALSLLTGDDPRYRRRCIRAENGRDLGERDSNVESGNHKYIPCPHIWMDFGWIIQVN